MFQFLTSPVSSKRTLSVFAAVILGSIFVLSFSQLSFAEDESADAAAPKVNLDDANLEKDRARIETQRAAAKEGKLEGFSAATQADCPGCAHFMDDSEREKQRIEAAPDTATRPVEKKTGK